MNAKGKKNHVDIKIRFSLINILLINELILIYF